MLKVSMDYHLLFSTLCIQTESLTEPLTPALGQSSQPSCSGNPVSICYVCSQDLHTHTAFKRILRIQTLILVLAPHVLYLKSHLSIQLLGQNLKKISGYVHLRLFLVRMLQICKHFGMSSKSGKKTFKEGNKRGITDPKYGIY